MRPARWSVHAAAFRAPHAAACRQSGTPTRSTCARRRGNGDDLIGLAPALAAALPGAAFVIGGDLLPVQALRRPPVFLIHGDADEVVPAAAMYAPVAGLQAAEIPVQWSCAVACLMASTRTASRTELRSSPQLLPRRVPRDCRSPDREDHRPARIRTRGHRRRARRAAPSGWSRPCEIRAVRRGTSDRPQAGLCGAALRP